MGNPRGYGLLALSIELQATIRNRADCFSESELFSCQIELQNVVVRLTWINLDREFGIVIPRSWTPDQIEAVASMRTLEVCKWERRRRTRAAE